MNSSQFMDKQVMGISGSQNNDLLELLNPQEEHNGDAKKEEILPSYDFQQIRPIGNSQPVKSEGSSVGGTRVWNSVDSTTKASGVRNYGSLDLKESTKVTHEKDQNVYDAAIVSEIDRTMKKHADNLLNVLEGVGARLSQLESRTRHLESSVDDLKVSVGNTYGSTDGKLRQLGNVIREVQTGVQVLRDKQEIAEAQMQLCKLQVSKGDEQSENENSVVHVESAQQAVSVPQQSQQPLIPSVAPPQQLPALPPPNAPPPPSLQNLPLTVQIPPQLPQNQAPPIPQRDPYFPPPGQTQEATHQQYQLPQMQQQPPPPPATHQQYQAALQLSQYSQPPQQSQQPHPPLPSVNPPIHQVQPPLPSHHEEATYMPSQSYVPSIRQPPSQPLSGPPPAQQIYGPPSHMYEPPPNRPSSGFSAGYGPPSGPNFSDSYPYSGSPSHYSSSPMKPSQFPSSPSAPGGGSSYPRLPTAQLLPHALPTASSVGSGSSSGGSGNRVPIDDVVDKVTSMGFPRDMVKGTVRKLTENGQSVDLNVVLDKLMNDDVQPQKGWFGR